jgi:hypothetical protein
MNDKDKEVFEAWWKEYTSNLSDTPTEWDVHDAWQAACEYKQEEIDFLKDRNETNISKVTCINQVNDGLHLLLKEAEAENKKLRTLIDDLVNNGMDYDIATRLEELEDEGA